MNKTIKICLIICSLLLTSLMFIVPFMVRSEQDSVLSVLSWSLTAISTIATLITVFIAFQLYDRFGLSSEFVRKQADSVLELANLLKGKTFYIHHEAYVYNVRPSISQLKFLKSEIPNSILSKRLLIDPNDYLSDIEEINKLSRSYWLPNNIKNRLKFLIIMGVWTPSKDKGDYLCMTIRKNTDDCKWNSMMPEISLEEFMNNLYELVNSIDMWIYQHFGVSIDFKLEEPFIGKK